MPGFMQWHGSDLILQLYVQPGAKKDQISGNYAGRLKIRIAAPAVDNKANKHLIKFLSKYFEVPLSRVILLKGTLQKQKLLKIEKPGKIPPQLLGEFDSE